MSEDKWKVLEQKARDIKEVAELIGELNVYLRLDKKQREKDE